MPNIETVEFWFNLVIPLLGGIAVTIALQWVGEIVAYFRSRRSNRRRGNPGSRAAYREALRRKELGL